jgi:putative hydrolase of the HAD superfamily
MKLKQLQGIQTDSVKNIIFDLGGVIINIDYSLTIDAFKKFGVTNFDQIYSKMHQSDLFDKLDKGLVTAYEFRSHIKKESGINISDEQFDEAWNAMLLDLPVERIDLLKNISQNYRIFLLSNTNEIHLNSRFRQFEGIFGVKGFKGLFEREYYSNLMGMRKPDADIYIQVLEENNLKGEETLFIDDSPQNIDGAINAGLQAFYLIKEMDIVQLFE